MRRLLNLLSLGSIVFALIGGQIPSALASSDTQDTVNVTVIPVRYTAVKGSAETFKLQHWMKDGYAGGFKDILLEHKTSDSRISLEGDAIPEENSVKAHLALEKDSLGSINAVYQSFRKYYSSYGAVYKPFENPNHGLAVNKLNKDLHMDFSRLDVTADKPLNADSDVSLNYQRHEKAGTKSRLAWTAVNNGSGTVNIGPSWQKVSESTDTIALKASSKIHEVNVSGEQKWEFLHANSFRQENYLATTSGSGTKIRTQDQIPESDSVATTLRGDRWFLNDKSYVAVAYRYSQLRNSEVENLIEYTDAGIPHNYSNPKNAVDALAFNKLDSHTWTGHYVANLTPTLSLIGKLKTELIMNKGSSTYPHDTSPATPDGIIDTTDVSFKDNKINRVGENISLRYNGLPHTALYSELDLEQTRNWLTENRTSPTVGEQISRGTLTHIQKTIWTLGSYSAPLKNVSVSTQIKHRLEDNDYDDEYESVYSSGAKSAFIDDIKLPSDEVATKWSWKPYQWLQTAFRYQYLRNKYLPRAENEIAQKSISLSNVFTYDVTVQPLKELLMTLSYSQQNSKTSTPASLATSMKTPGFKSNVNSWLLSASYVPKDNFSLINSVSYSLARNFDNYSNYTLGLPLGADFDQMDFSTQINWTIRKDIKVNPGYMYSFYKANSDVALGNYNAHTFWCDVALSW